VIRKFMRLVKPTRRSRTAEIDYARFLLGENYATGVHGNADLSDAGLTGAVINL
jgi:hypothetical protein